MIWRADLASWRLVAFVASVPLMVAAALLVALPADARLWFEVQRDGRRGS